LAPDPQTEVSGGTGGLSASVFRREKTTGGQAASATLDTRRSRCASSPDAAASNQQRRAFSTTDFRFDWFRSTGSVRWATTRTR